LTLVCQATEPLSTLRATNQSFLDQLARSLTEVLGKLAFGFESRPRRQQQLAE
jgi:hypothetical protein